MLPPCKPRLLVLAALGFVLTLAAAATLKGAGDVAGEELELDTRSVIVLSELDFCKSLKRHLLISDTVRFTYCKKNCDARIAAGTQCPAPGVKDISKRCNYFNTNYNYCTKPEKQEFVKHYCAKTCGFCVIENVDSVCTAQTGYDCVAHKQRYNANRCATNHKNKCKKLQVFLDACNTYFQHP